jgi:BirA family transcriptional regulator, biotin operon repressor / biotin---[acetyl-CoA-carboxylase] ligase
MAAMIVAPPLEVVDVTTSTNSDLLERAWDGPDKRASLMALDQTAGRGRRGRSWLAPAGASLCLSISSDFLDPQAQHSARLPGLSLAIGAAAAQTLEAAAPSWLAPGRIGLKWPNDLVLRPEAGQGGTPLKCGGILIEVRHQGPLLRVVVGIGLNLLPADLALHEASSLPVGALFQAGKCLDRLGLATQLAQALHQVVQECAHAGWEPWRAQFERRHVLQGVSVQLSGGSADLASDNATVVGIAADGALRVRRPGQEIMSVYAGEVSVRARDWESKLHV